MAGFDVPLWFGLAAPKGTPRPIVEKLAAALDKTLAMPVLEAKAGRRTLEGPRGIDFSDILYQPDVAPAEVGRYCQVSPGSRPGQSPG